MNYTLAELCKRVGGEIEGDADVAINGLGDIRTAGAGQLAFIESERFARYVPESKAAAIMIDRDAPSLGGKTLLRVENPRDALQKGQEVRVTEVAHLLADGPLDFAEGQQLYGEILGEHKEMTVIVGRRSRQRLHLIAEVIERANGTDEILQACDTYAIHRL